MSSGVIAGLPQVVMDSCRFCFEKPLNPRRALTWGIAGDTVCFYDQDGRNWEVRKEVMERYFPSSLGGNHGIIMQRLGFDHSTSCKDPW